MSPHGPCFASRKYFDEGGVDPQLVSALVVANQSLGNDEVLDEAVREIYSDGDLKFFIHKSYNYISAVVTDVNFKKSKTRSALRKLNRLAYESLGNSSKLTSVNLEQINKIEQNIDIIVANAGLLG